MKVCVMCVTGVHVDLSRCVSMCDVCGGVYVDQSICVSMFDVCDRCKLM